MAKPTPLLLVVEGLDDKHVLWALLKHHEFQPGFDIKDEGGYEKLYRNLSPRLKPGSDLERLGIVVDSDVNILARWESIKAVLERAGYDGVPDRPDSRGTVIEHEVLPRVGVWIMPNNELPGMLEDYLALLVPAGDSLFERATQCVDAIPIGDRRFAEVHHTKALLHTWLAWQDDPGTPLGQAITKRYFAAEGRNVSEFLDWLTRLFT